MNKFQKEISDFHFNSRSGFLVTMYKFCKKETSKEEKKNLKKCNDERKREINRWTFFVVFMINQK